jgi:hypothetical protein
MRRREFRLSQQLRSSMAPGRASAGARRPGAVGQSGQLRGRSRCVQQKRCLQQEATWSLV